MSTRKTTEQFIVDAINKHGNKYDYSNIVYLGDSKKIHIVCPKHGGFDQVASSHLQGIGCKKCFIESKTKSIDQLIIDFRNIHGDKYDYSNANYINAITKINIACPIHGLFLQEPHSHLKGQGCPECCRENRMDTQDEFIKKAIASHGVNLYDYSKVIYKDSHTKVCIICKRHGDFLQKPNIHLMGCGCQKCKKVVLLDGTICDSKVEAYWYLCHKNSGIPFVHNERYGKELGRMRYDFYFPSLNTYEEVTAFDLSRDAEGLNKRIKDVYLLKIDKKRKYVEGKGSKFVFIEDTLTKDQYKYLFSNIKSSY